LSSKAGASSLIAAQPNSCIACFKLCQKNTRFTLFKKMIPYDKEAEDALHSTEISSIQIKAVQSFLRINDKFHNAEGLEIKRHILHFQTAITSNLSKHIVHLSGDSKTVPGLDLLISNFSDFYRNTFGSRERGHVGTEMHYQQLNMRWFEAACSGSSIAGTPQLDSLRQNVLFQIKDNIYRVLTVYSKTYNKWLEVDSVPMSHLHKTANLHKVHACRLVEDVLSFSGSQRKFGPAADHIELLTDGHDIAAGTIIGSLADASLKLMKEANETCKM
jgi:hypothetical protein